MPETTKAALVGLDALPLHALLSAALVAFTLEADDEVELGHNARGEDGSRFSLVAWLNVVQYLGSGPVPVEDICSYTFTKPAQVGFAVGCLERWGFVSVVTEPGGSPRSTKREGWGSARAITAHSVLALTEKGHASSELWPKAIETVEARWQRRLGPALTAGLKAVSALAVTPRVLMPQGVPSGWMPGDWRQFPAGTLGQPAEARVPIVLGRALLAVTMAYEQESAIPLALAANVLRVIDDEGTPTSELRERSGISSQIAGVLCTALTKNLGFAEERKDATRRRKLLRLTPAGREARAAHTCTIEAVDERFGATGTKAARALRGLLGASENGELALRAALTPPPGVRRSGAPAPALGRTTTASAAVARNREITAQTARFVSDPFRTLPHYPVWDGNRGFGP